jgi:hypothetical protein
MATVEDKIETLIDQVKEIQLEQVKHYSKLDDVVTWKDTAQKTTRDLQDTILKLTSHVAALEASPSRLPTWSRRTRKRDGPAATTFI